MINGKRIGLQFLGRPKITLRWFDILFILLFLYLLVCQIQAIWSFTIDDMYISLRYAKNWASGHGLLWNIDSPPVEGYSNFSFVAIAALALHFGINPVIALKFLGLIGLVVTCIFLFLISRFWFEKRLSLIPCIWLLLYKGEIIWAISGLETALYQAMICGSVYFIFRGLGYNVIPVLTSPQWSSRTTIVYRESRNYLIGAGLMLSLAGMTRPETPLLMLVFFLLMCLDKPKLAPREYWKSLACFCLTISLVYIPYFLWRWHYYGFLFPNTVYCKGLEGSSWSVDLSYLQLIWPFALLALIAIFKAQDKRHYFFWLPNIIYLGMLAHADSISAFYNRLFLPAFALLIPLAFQGLGIIVAWYLKTRKTVFVWVLFIVSFYIAVLFIPKMSIAQYRFFSQNPVSGEKLRQSVADWLNTYALVGDTVVLGDAGLIPFYSNLKFIDSYCLNNAAMGHYPKERRYEQFCHQILKEQPQIIILTSSITKGEVEYIPSDLCFNKLLRKNNYNAITNFSVTIQPDSRYRYELFRHKLNQH